MTGSTYTLIELFKSLLVVKNKIKNKILFYP